MRHIYLAATGQNRGKTTVSLGVMDGFQRQLRAAVTSPFVRQRLTFVVSSEAAADLARVVELAEDGAFSPVVERTWPLSDAAAAIDHVTDGRARGKVVVSVRD